MDAVVLALVSAALFGSMTVALRFALARVPDAEAGALLTILAAFAVTLPFVAAGDIDLGGHVAVPARRRARPGRLAAPLHARVRDAGPSRTSVTVGTAPLFSVAIALAPARRAGEGGCDRRRAPDRRRRDPARARAGAARAREVDRPRASRSPRPIIFAVRDNLVRHLSLDTDVEPALAGGGDALRRRPDRRRLAARDAAAAAEPGPGRVRPGRASASASPISACSRPTTAAASRSSRRSSRRSRSGASASRRCCSAGTSSSARACSPAPRSSSPAAC